MNGRLRLDMMIAESRILFLLCDDRWCDVGEYNICLLIYRYCSRAAELLKFVNTHFSSYIWFVFYLLVLVGVLRS